MLLWVQEISLELTYPNSSCILYKFLERVTSLCWSKSDSVEEQCVVKHSPSDRNWRTVTLCKIHLYIFKTFKHSTVTAFWMSFAYLSYSFKLYCQPRHRQMMQLFSAYLILKGSEVSNVVQKYFEKWLNFKWFWNWEMPVIVWLSHSL